jgi:hypothetical protein
LPLVPESDTEFGVLANGGYIRFDLGPDGQPTGLTASLDGREGTFKRLPGQP